MVTVTADEARKNLGDLLKDVATGEVVVVTYYGVKIAAIIPIADLPAHKEQK